MNKWLISFSRSSKPAFSAACQSIALPKQWRN
jgi:hypothetical protein